MNDLEGKHLFVTAAGSGIGAAVARAGLRAGARITAVDVSRTGIDRLHDEYGGRVVTVQGDMSAEPDVAAAAVAAEAAFGPIDQLHHAVGGGRGMAPIVDMRVEDWDFTLALTLRSCFLVTKHVAPRVRDGGAIVHVASVNARLPHYAASSYASAKAAVLMFTKSSALELGPRLRVNAVLPGIVRTAATRDKTAPDSPSLRAFERASPLGRIAEPDDIAGPCLFLGSGQARHITGTGLVVDGGCEIAGYPDPRDYSSERRGASND
ncbi:SDR family oxidoreductase [Dactylosporangium sp. NPDC050688]|uniref:SDR family NAD(P)-dependent oxidoreductase n=1 Tax=Dactylosporangium sp. NPDC050688 TaxID=3157217 RepID=UPI0033CC34B4